MEDTKNIMEGDLFFANDMQETIGDRFESIRIGDNLFDIHKRDMNEAHDIIYEYELDINSGISLSFDVEVDINDIIQEEIGYIL